MDWCKFIWLKINIYDGITLGGADDARLGGGRLGMAHRSIRPYWWKCLVPGYVPTSA